MTICMAAAALLLLPEHPSAMAGYTAVLFICFFVIHFAYSWGPMCWVYPAEIFPMHIKSKAVSFTTCGNWVTNMIFGYYTPDWLALLEPSGLFFMFACFGVICAVFVLEYIPETKGISLEQIDSLFENFKGGISGKAGSAQNKRVTVGKPSDFMMTPASGTSSSGNSSLGDGLLG